MIPISREHKLLIEMVMRQTTYSYDEAKKQLDDNDNNYVKVIKDSFGISEKKEEPVISINQQIYKEIRDLMDTASNTHIINQERDKKKQEHIEKIKKNK
jgi:hypothetical protein